MGIKVECLKCQHVQEVKPLLYQPTNYECEKCGHRCYTFADKQHPEKGVFSM